MLAVGRRSSVSSSSASGRRPRDRLEPLDPLLVRHALGLQPRDLAPLRRVLLGVEHLAGIVEHRLDHADHVDDVRRIVAVERGDHLDRERHQRRREPQRARSSSPSTSDPTRTPTQRPSRVAAAFGHAGRLEAAVDRDRPARCSAARRRCRGSCAAGASAPLARRVGRARWRRGRRSPGTATSAAPGAPTIRRCIDASS